MTLKGVEDKAIGPSNGLHITKN